MSGVAYKEAVWRAAAVLNHRNRPSSPLHVFIFLFVVPVYTTGILVVQLQALLAGSRLTVLRHHENVKKMVCYRMIQGRKNKEDDNGNSAA
jgi:hypothetical protein